MDGVWLALDAELVWPGFGDLLLDFQRWRRDWLRLIVSLVPTVARLPPVPALPLHWIGLSGSMSSPSLIGRGGGILELGLRCGFAGRSGESLYSDCWR